MALPLLALPALPLLAKGAAAVGVAAAGLGAADALTPGGNVNLPGVERDTSGWTPQVTETQYGLKSWRWFDPKTGNYYNILPHEEAKMRGIVNGGNRQMPLPDPSAIDARRDTAQMQGQLLRQLEEDRAAGRSDRAFQRSLLQGQQELQRAELGLRSREIEEAAARHAETVRAQERINNANLTYNRDRDRIESQDRNAQRTDAMSMYNAGMQYKAGVERSGIEADVNIARTNTGLRINELQQAADASKRNRVQGYLTSAIEALSRMG